MVRILQIRQQEDQFFVQFIVTHVRRYWHPVVKIKGKADDGVIDDDHVLQGSVLDDSEVFYEKAVRVKALLSCEEMADVFAMRVEVVYNGFSV